MEGYTYVYILRSKVDPYRFYTGLTTDLRRRLQEHNSGNAGSLPGNDGIIVGTQVGGFSRPQNFYRVIQVP